MRGASLIVALSFAAAACTVVGPDYERPQVEMPGTWRVDSHAAISNSWAVMIFR